MKYFVRYELSLLFTLIIADYLISEYRAYLSTPENRS